MLQAEGGLADEVARLPDRQGARLLDEAGEVDAFDKLHCDVVRAVDLVGIVSADDVGVDELAGGANLALEPPYHARDGKVLAADDLERDGSLERDVPRLEDLPHAAFAELVQDDIGSERQLVAAALGDGVDLVNGEPAAAHDGPREGTWLLVLLLQFRQLSALSRIEKRAAVQGFDEAG